MAAGEQRRQVVASRPRRQVPPVTQRFPDAAAGVGFRGVKSATGLPDSWARRRGKGTRIPGLAGKWAGPGLPGERRGPGAPACGCWGWGLEVLGLRGSRMGWEPAPGSEGGGRSSTDFEDQSESMKKAKQKKPSSRAGSR